MHVTNADRPVAIYSLDVMSNEGMQFRIWANKVLKEYLIKGYSVNEQRLKEQTHFIGKMAQNGLQIML